ncbi:MAG TPA: stage 0 sporulation family protein [Firmicutes bacterium]|nr:stage 0 sporulation family protein [Bacillota bacterium]
MVEIIGIRFSALGKIYYFDPKGFKLKTGDMVLVETARGLETGKVVLPNRLVEDGEIVSPLKSILRVAGDRDFKRMSENKVKEEEAFKIANEQIAKHKLDMKLIDVEYTFDGSKILFYFTADGRVDFRELVKSLASLFKTRIELRQIGVRDEARKLGGIGICGRGLCCNTFLDEFRPVSIKMAKEQGLSLNPTKISGVCGRLMCCLQYEQSAYDDALKNLPSKGAQVKTPDGIGTVSDVMTLKQQIRVKFGDGDEVKFADYSEGEYEVVGKSKNRAAGASNSAKPEPETKQDLKDSADDAKRRQDGETHNTEDKAPDAADNPYAPKKQVEDVVETKSITVDDDGEVIESEVGHNKNKKSGKRYGNKGGYKNRRRRNKGKENNNADVGEHND